MFPTCFPHFRLNSPRPFLLCRCHPPFPLPVVPTIYGCAMDALHKPSPVSLPPLLKLLPLWRFSRAFTLLSVSSLFRERDVLYIRGTQYGHRNGIIESNINQHDSWDKGYCASGVEHIFAVVRTRSFVSSRGLQVLVATITI